jgi:hypothetical protein
MKNLIISAIATIFSINTFAAAVEWQEIESKKCDDSAAVAVKDESVAILDSQALLAFKKKDEAGCNYADFYSVLTVASGTTNGTSMKVVQPVMPVARKNCRNEMSQAPAAFFSMATIVANQIELQNVESCKILVLKLKPKVPANP